MSCGFTGDYAGQRVDVRDAVVRMCLLQILVAGFLNRPAAVQIEVISVREKAGREPRMSNKLLPARVERADDMPSTRTGRFLQA